MTYFWLFFNPEEMGYIPQDDSIIGDYYVDAPNSLRHFKFNDQMEQLWVPDGVKFRYHAKFTDILSFTRVGYPYLILSEKFLKVMLSLHLPKHQVFPLNVIKREKVVQYNLFISKECFAEYLDFEESVFFIGTHQNRALVREPIEIKNAAEFWRSYNQMKEDANLGASKIALNYSLIEYDLFRLPRGIGGPTYLVSEIFVEAVTKAGLTGVRFIPFDGK